MNEPAITLRDLFKKKWTLENAPEANICFRVGEPANLNDRFAHKQISLEVLKSASPVIHQNQARTVFTEIIPIGIWIKITPATDKAKEETFEKRQSIIGEIRRIIHENRKSVINVRFAYLGGDRHLDSFPYLHSVVNVKCTYSYP